MNQLDNHMYLRLKISLAIIVALVMMSCAKQNPNSKTYFISQNTTPKKFFNQDGQFKIQFEAEPSAYSQYVPYEGGKILMNYFIYEKGINLIYCISYADYPEAFIKDKVPEDFLNGLLETYIDQQKAGLEVQKKLTVNTYPGIFFKASNSDTFVFGEYVLRKNRLYQITVTKEGSYHNETEANTFLQSLELL